MRRAFQNGSELVRIQTVSVSFGPMFTISYVFVFSLLRYLCGRQAGFVRRCLCAFVQFWIVLFLFYMRMAFSSTFGTTGSRRTKRAFLVKQLRRIDRWQKIKCADGIGRSRLRQIQSWLDGCQVASHQERCRFSLRGPLSAGGSPQDFSDPELN